MKTRILIELELSLKKKLKIRAVQQNLTTKEYITHLVEEDLKDKKPIELDCPKNGIKIKRSRSKNQSYKLPQERIIT